MIMTDAGVHKWIQRCLTHAMLHLGEEDGDDPVVEQVLGTDFAQAAHVPHHVLLKPPTVR